MIVFSKTYELQSCYRRDSVPTTLGYFYEVIMSYVFKSWRTRLSAPRSLQRSSASQPVPQSYYDQEAISFQADSTFHKSKPSDHFTEISQGHRDRVPISTSNLSQALALFWRQHKICVDSSHLSALKLTDNHRNHLKILSTLELYNRLLSDLFLSPNQSTGVPIQQGVLQKT